MTNGLRLRQSSSSSWVRYQAWIAFYFMWVLKDAEWKLKKTWNCFTRIIVCDVFHRKLTKSHFLPPSPNRRGCWLWDNDDVGGRRKTAGNKSRMKIHSKANFRLVCIKLKSSFGCLSSALTFYGSNESEISLCKIHGSSQISAENLKNLF